MDISTFHFYPDVIHNIWLEIEFTNITTDFVTNIGNHLTQRVFRRILDAEMAIKKPEIKYH